jgi:hypothetical protein
LTTDFGMDHPDLSSALHCSRRQSLRPFHGAVAHREPEQAICRALLAHKGSVFARDR